jgi:hypothetical protein
MCCTFEAVSEFFTVTGHVSGRFTVTVSGRFTVTVTEFLTVYGYVTVAVTVDFN